MFYWIIKWITWPLRAFYFRVEAQGLEHFPREGPVIVVANHASYLDAGILGSVLPRKVHFIVLSGMYAMWRIRWFYAGMGTIPVTPGKPEHGSIRRALNLLKDSRVLGVFPEGTRSPDGKLRPPLPGAALIAMKSGAAVIPAGILGAFEAYPPGRILPTPRKIRVRFGPPFRSGTGARRGREALDDFGARMMREISCLMEEPWERQPGRAGEESR